MNKPGQKIVNIAARIFQSQVESVATSRVTLSLRCLRLQRCLSSCSNSGINGINAEYGFFKRTITTTPAQMFSNPIVTYEEVKTLSKYPEKLLVDVRNPEELKENGVIPTAINIPRKSVLFILE